MTNPEIVGKFFIFAAAINKISQENPDDLLLNELAKDVQSKFLTSPEYISYTKPLFNNRLVFANDAGDVLPSIGGWNKISPRKKVISKMVVKPIEKMTDREVVDTFVKMGDTICDRLENGKQLQRLMAQNAANVQEMMECVVLCTNKMLGVETIIEELEEA